MTSHLDHIDTRLDIGSRSELAIALAKRGLVRFAADGDASGGRVARIERALRLELMRLAESRGSE